MGIVSNESAIKRVFQLPGDIVSLIVSLLALPVISILFWQRFQYRVPHVKRFTTASLTLLSTYVTAWLFVFALSTVVHIRAPRYDNGHCQAKIYVCLVLYLATKLTGLLFLIERAYVTSFPANPRWKTPEYIFTCIGILVPVTAVAVYCLPNIIAYDNGDNVCIVGIDFAPLVSFMLTEVCAYLVLTIRFLVPLLRCHFGGPGLLPPLRRAVRRTCIGTAITMMSTLTAKISLVLFNGEPDWLCCMTCKIDVLIAVCVLHWITVPEILPEERGSPQALGLSFEKDLERSMESGRESGGESNKTAPSSCGTVELNERGRDLAHYGEE